MTIQSLRANIVSSLVYCSTFGLSSQLQHCLCYNELMKTNDLKDTEGKSKTLAIVSLVLSCISMIIAARILWESFQMHDCKTYIGLKFSSGGVSCKYAGLAGIVFAVPGLSILSVAIACLIISIVKNRNIVNPRNYSKLLSLSPIIVCVSDIIIFISAFIIGWM